MSDTPSSLIELQRRFPDDAACARYLVGLRWPDGFRCPRCADDHAWMLQTKARTYECAGCGKQTSVTAGTVMHGSKLALTVWFWAAYLMAGHSNGISASQLWKLLGLGSYKTAWLLCAKLRRAMVDPERDPLVGVVEVDETTIAHRSAGGPMPPRPGRSLDGRLPIAAAVEVSRARAQFRRWRLRSDRVGGDFPREPKPTFLGGLDTHFLANAFAWLFPGEMDLAIPEEEIEVHTELVAAFWMYQKWWLCGSAEDEGDNYPTMSNFGYSLLGELARLVVTCPADNGPSLWRPVFTLGPKGHYTIGHFLSCWFAQLTESTVVTNFLQRWRLMVEFVLLDGEWADSGPWYYAQQLERRVLGFESTAFLKRVAAHGTIVGGMRDLYRVWADKRLHSDEDNLASFCAFLASEVGRPLRLDGLMWMASALRNNPECGNWYRHSTSSAFVECLDVLVLEHADELKRDNAAREALIELSTHAASRQLTAALQLQERIRGVFREEPR